MEHSIELDFAQDADTVPELLAILKAYASEHGCKGFLVQAVGPGGGWPLVRFTGKAGAIQSLIADYAQDEGEIEALLEDVEPRIP